MHISTAIRNAAAIVFVPFVTAAQSNLLRAGTDAWNVGAAFTVNDAQSYTTASVGGTYTARLDVEMSYAKLSRNIIYEVKDATSYSFSASYTFLRAERAGIYGSFQYSYGALKTLVKDDFSSYPNYTFHSELEHTNSYALTAGRLPGDPTSFTVVPSVAIGMGFVSNASPTEKAAFILSAELVFVVPLSDRIQFLPYLGIGETNGISIYSAGFRLLFPMAS